jgi:hypothetical protein
VVEKRSELAQRRAQLTDLLPKLSDNQAHTYRRNSDALARDRAGVKQESAHEMTRLGEAEVSAAKAVRDAQRELRDIDVKIAGLPRSSGLSARFQRGFRGARKR